MSLVAEFRRLSSSALPDLAAAAAPKRRLFGRSEDTYPGLLASSSTEVATYDWSGMGVVDTLVFLEERGIDLLSSGEQDENVTAILEARELSGTVLTYEHRSEYLDRLRSASYNPDELAAWHREFSETDDPDAPRMMADAVRALVASLESLDANSVVLVTVG